MVFDIQNPGFERIEEIAGQGIFIGMQSRSQAVFGQSFDTIHFFVVTAQGLKHDQFLRIGREFRPLVSIRFYTVKRQLYNSSGSSGFDRHIIVGDNRFPLLIRGDTFRGAFTFGPASASPAALVGIILILPGISVNGIAEFAGIGIKIALYPTCINLEFYQVFSGEKSQLVEGKSGSSERRRIFLIQDASEFFMVECRLTGSPGRIDENIFFFIAAGITIPEQVGISDPARFN